MIQRRAVPYSPLVSVLLPAYNHERFVERFLDSVLEDPYPSKELVIIDDGSMDGTRERIAAWIVRHGADLPVEFVCRANKGIAATLNELAARARGQYLRLGASDDYLLPGGIGAQVAYLQSRPRKWAVVGDSIVVDAQGRQLHDSGMQDLHGADKRMYASDEGIRRAVISRWAIGGPVALIRRKGLESVAGWSETLRIDDWDFFLRLAAHDALGFIDRPVCAYRLHGENFSRTRNRRVRVHNLMESRDVALRRACMFSGPFLLLMRAQAHVIGAKIHFLEHRYGAVAGHMLAYAMFSAMAWVRMRSAQRALPRRVEHA
ncbi:MULTISPECIES: glycosyltransferase [Dyella]|uniref:Glycosyltransferase n=2 Tax=Dyella TaxID=231454 RepID=A0A4R0Z1A4_9GAMM|nr:MULTISPECIES: glycosyltransferase [Dyella]TBR39469.1 glycosyltransferase [Dyella terrae]TCI12946.1 glycosyltransferase [Dyella soli]